MKYTCFILLLLTIPACKRSGGGDDVLFSVWTHPANLNDNISLDGTDAFTPVIAANNNGHILIAWVQSDGTHDQVFKSEFRSSTSKLPELSELPELPLKLPELLPDLAAIVWRSASWLRSAVVEV